MLALLLPDWPILARAFVFLVAAAVAQASMPMFISETLKGIIDGQNAGTLHLNTFIGPLRNYLLAGVVAAVCASLRGSSFITVAAKASTRLRSQLFESLVKQDIGFFDKTKTGEITSRLTQDCQKVIDQISFNVNFFTRTFVELITTLCFMFYYSKRLTLTAFVTVPFLVFLSKKVGNYMRTLSENTQQSLAEGNAIAEEALASISTVRTLAGERAEETRFLGKLKEYAKLELQRARIYVGYLTSVTLLPELGKCLVLFQIGILCMQGLPAQTLLAFIFYLDRLNGCFNSLADIWTTVQQAIGSATRVFELIDREPDGRLRVSEGLSASHTESPVIAGHLQLHDVHFSYPKRPERRTLKGLTLDCPPGKVVALVGPSGGGKSTCIGLFQRLYEPQNGTVILDGRDVAEYDSHVFTEAVTTVSQEPVLFGFTVQENILYGLPDEHPARVGSEHNQSVSAAVIRAAELANAHDFISNFSQGYHTEVGERGVALSGGQKQRIAIARALVRKPKVLLLDEATSALDAESELKVQQAIDKLMSKQDLTVVIVAHRLSTVKGADKICVVADGVIVEEGTHEELLQLPEGRYRRLVNQQLQGSTAMH